MFLNNALQARAIVDNPDSITAIFVPVNQIMSKETVEFFNFLTQNLQLSAAVQYQEHNAAINSRRAKQTIEGSQ